MAKDSATSPRRYPTQAGPLGSATRREALTTSRPRGAAPLPIWLVVRLGVALRVVVFAALLAGTGTGTAAQPATEGVGADWDHRYDRPTYVYGTEPVEFLRQVADRLKPGRALVLAAGEGRNAVFLAQQGFEVTAVDVSARGLAKCAQLAAEHGVSVHTVVADLDTFDLGHEAWDLITDFYYHDVALYPRIMPALTPGGFFVLQNFSRDQPGTNRFGPRNPAWLAAPNELTRAFDAWRIRHYEDTEVVLDEGMHQGAAAVVRLLVEKVPADLEGAPGPQ